MSRTRGVFLAIILLALLIVVIGLVYRQLWNKLAPATTSIEGTQASGDTPIPLGSNDVLVTLASSSTKKEWMDRVMARFNAAGHKTSTGKTIVVQASYVTSGGSRDDILNGTLKPVAWSPGDQSWVGYLNTVWRQRTNRPIVSQACAPTIYAPIGFAMWRPMAETLGWPDKPIGWDVIVKLAADPNGWATYGRPEWGRFRFGHTHPAYSNSGLLSLITFVYGLVGSDKPLTAADVYQPEVEEAMRILEQSTSKYGQQSSALFDLMASQGPGYLHAIAASEETTLRYNVEHGAELQFPLAFIFPAGGTIWADQPYCILDGAEWVSPEQAEAAALFRDYLLAREQQEMAIDSRLRPLDSSIPLRAPLDLATGTDPRVTPQIVPFLPAPDDNVSAAVIDLFKITKRKATIIVVLDISGSMKGDKIKTATTATAEFLRRLDPADEVAVLIFNSAVVTLSEPRRVSEIVEELSQRVSTLMAGGNTALYDAVCKATELIGRLRAEDQAQGESRLYGIVLLSDGEDTVGRPTENQMFTVCLPSSAEADGVKVFPIAFGKEANEALLSRVAQVTGGRLFTADPASIGDVYFAISAEQ